MLSEKEFEQLMVTFEYASAPLDDGFAVEMGDLRKILSGYVCRSSSSAVTIPFSTPSDCCRKEL